MNAACGITALHFCHFKPQLKQRVFQSAVFDFKRIEKGRKVMNRSFPNGGVRKRACNHVDGQGLVEEGLLRWVNMGSVSSSIKRGEVSPDKPSPRGFANQKVTS
jgi:hypothetical protein